MTNGQSCTPDSEISKFRFKKGKTHLLRLVNTGAEGLQYFSIDDHVMTVIANDFVPIVPYETDVVTLGIGQRYDVLIKATGKASDAVWMRSNISTVCSLPQQPYALAAVYYNQANESSTPKSLATPFERNCANVSLRFWHWDGSRLITTGGPREECSIPCCESIRLSNRHARGRCRSWCQFLWSRTFLHE